MPAFRRAKSFLFDRGGKKSRSAGIVIAMLGLGAAAYFLLPTADETLQRVRRTAPDSLQAYLLKPDDRRALAEFYRLQQSGEASVRQRWAYQNRCRLQFVGLHLTEQSMLFRRRAQSSWAQSKLDTAFALGHMLMACAQDSFLARQAERIKNLDAHALKTRAQVSESFAVARDIFSRRNYADAAKRLERTRTLAKKKGDDKFLIDASYLLQYALNRQPRHERVVALGREILAKARQTGYHLCLATALAEAAEAYASLNSPDSALVFLRDAVAFAESMGDTVGLARCHFSRAQIHADLGDYAEAERSLERVLVFDLPQRYRGQVLSIQAQIAKLRCEYDPADGLFREALQVYQTRGDSANQSQTLIELSMVKTLIGDYAGALAFGRQALRLSSVIKDQNRIAVAFSQVGWVYLQVDSLSQAIVALKKAVALLSKDRTIRLANAWTTLGRGYLKQGDLAAARSAFLRAEEIAQSRDWKVIQTEARLGQGWVALQERQASQAQAWLASSLDLARRIGEESLIAESLRGISEAHKQAGNRAEALETLERALAIGETLRTSLREDSARVRYFSARQDWFDTAILSSLTLGDAGRAFHFAERARAQAMRDALMAGALDQDTQTIAASGLAIPPPAELQRRIPPDAQVLAYRVTADTTLVWLLENDKLLVRRIALTARVLADTVQRFLKSVGAQDYEDFRRRCKNNPAQVYDENRALGKRLFQILLAPLTGELKAERKLYIIPDGPLHLVPWGALVTDQDNFLDETLAWAKTPSLAILASASNAHAHAPVTRDSKLLMVAGDWASVAAQRNSLKGRFDHFKLLHKADATIENVRQALLAGQNIAYFSVRAVADMNHPSNSYLELADEPAQPVWRPRKAYMRELSGWDFTKTHLAILNACETASGKIERGEGGMSMASFFTRKRVPHVMASLWQNDDRASALIIDEFFRGLQNDQNMIFGLQQAKQKCLNTLKSEARYPLPYFWATFELHEASFSNSVFPQFN